MDGREEQERLGPICEKVNLWVGEDHTFTADELQALTWAFIMDDEARAAFDAFVNEAREDYIREADSARR